jgi:hypothetical protein
LAKPRNLLALASGLAALAAVMLAWPGLFLSGKVMMLPAWAQALPSPVNTGAYLAFLCLMPVAFLSDTFANAARAMAAAVAVAPLFAVASWAFDPMHHDGNLGTNLVFNYLWIVAFSLLVPAALLLVVRKLAGWATRSARNA